MDKEFYESKTVWGFGLLGLALIGQALGWVPENTFTELFNIATGLLGVYGLRDAL